MVRLKDIAEKTGYSISVISRALKPNCDKSDTTSEKTKEYIRSIAQKMGYTSNINASSLRRGRTPAVGIFLPPYSSSLVADLVFGFSEVSLNCRYPLFYAPGYTVEAFSQFLNNSERMSSAGIIIYFTFNNLLDNPEFKLKVRNEIKANLISGYPYKKMREWNKKLFETVCKFAENGGKVILFNEPPVNYDYESLGIRSVCCDDFHGGEIAADYLLSQSCEHFVCIRNWNRCSCDRFSAFSKRLNENGKFCLDIDFFEPSEIRDMKFFSSRLDDFLSKNKTPLGLFVTSDVLLLETYNYCIRNNYVIGKDVKIISYNNQEFVNHLDPPVASILQPMREAGKVAMNKMVDMLNEKNVKSEFVAPKLIIR